MGSLHNEEVQRHSRRLRWTGHVAGMEEGRITFKIASGKPIKKIPLGMSRRIYQDNFRMNLIEMGVIASNRFDSAQDRDY